MDTPLETQPRRFYDGGPSGGQPDPTSPPLIVLERTLDMDVDEFRMGRRLGYRDRELGQLLVPVDTATYTTDLTSVPSIFLWLVPRTGRHLPAALLHDGLVRGSFTAAPDVTIDRERADLVFRAAMADTGTGLIRRWLMWTAVTLGTIFQGRGTSWSSGERRRWRLTAGVTLLLTAVLGVLATFDLFDIRVPIVGGVPWMGEHAWWVELMTGALGAIVIPILLGLTWGRFRAAGVIAGVALAVLLHITVAIALLTAAYRVAERIVTRPPSESDA
ncbi:hypothetical protein ASG73_06335 [Janibacter sp. Soil728]|uniref:DUF1353 domain-containing protein n=1 Tax=Janibacter sp. Soil728 TaxID=1736393 RepID=UPI0006F90429|nr:DUF1353 domain-containing protein [Janibacter sp. Soil728]KRE38540.1 hypothetical protein ASG73_06335 [Janibacter sp. Soil728]